MFVEGMSPQGSPNSGQDAGSAASAPSQPASHASPSPAPAAPPVTKSGENVSSGNAVAPKTGETVTNTYTPNWKFKASGKDHEIPEWLRGVVKDADTEKQLRELHEKAYGLDLVKNNHQAVQQQLQQFQKTILPEYDKLRQTVSSVVKFRDNKDLDSVFEAIGIPPQAVAQWMYKRIQLQDMPPEQRAEFEHAQTLRKQNYELQQKVETLSQGSAQAEMQTRAFELQTALARPEIQTVAESYNTRMGQPDAFWNFVCQQADYLERTSGQRVTAQQATAEAIRILGNPIVPSPAQGLAANAGNPGATPQAGQGQGSPTPPLIPNVTGARNMSPTKKVARSTDELRKMGRELAGKQA